MTVENVLNKKLTDEFSPLYLEVKNESYMHNVPTGSESHFKVVIVSDAFEGVKLIGRHRMVNTLLREELANHIHALTMHTYTPEQWRNLNADQIPNSPKCMGNG